MRSGLDLVSMGKVSSDEIKILPLGGLGEIGMNCLVVEYSNEMILVDCGVQFPDQNFQGVDILIPDLTYVRERLDNLKAIVVTHGHDDHIGAIPYLARDKKIDVYATPFPTGLLKNKMEEVSGMKGINFHEIQPRKKFKVGHFTFDPIPVSHSIIEALAFAIETPVGTIIHSGDFKHDAKDAALGATGFGPFEEYGKKGVLLLMSDSTNAERCGHTLGETDIAKSFQSIFEKQTGRLLIALFASNIKRIENLLQLAKSLGKKVAFIGRSMHSYTQLAHEQSAMKIPEDTLILIENIGEFPDDKVIVLATGSQAEPQSALLRISQGIHKFFQVKPGDQIIMSSRFIPGNERNITRMIDDLYRQGGEVMYEAVHQIHVSGHGFQDELLMMLKATKPKFFIPIHGAYRHLKKHSNLATSSGVEIGNAVVIEDGFQLALTEDSLRVVESYPLQKSALVEGTFVDANPEVLTHRANLAKTGIVIPVVMRRADNKELITDPVVHTYGLLLRKPETAEEIVSLAEKHLAAVYEESKRNADLSDVLRLEMRRFFKKRASHKPVVAPLIIDL